MRTREGQVRSIVRDQNHPMVFDYAVELGESGEQVIPSEDYCEAQ